MAGSIPLASLLALTHSSSPNQLVNSKSSPTDATSDDLDSDDLTAPLTVLSGANNTTFDQGFYNPATIGDYVWHDLNANGIHESNEPGVNGVSVSLMRGDTEVATTLTAGGGYYSFSAEPGTYTVKFTKPSSYSNISPTNAANDNIDSDGLTVPVTVVSGETNNSIDLGLFNVATIGNFVWNDVNANGIQDPPELGINGVAVALMQGATEVASTTTTGGGLYSFVVAPGAYTIKFTLPAGFTEASQPTRPATIWIAMGQSLMSPFNRVTSTILTIKASTAWLPSGTTSGTTWMLMAFKTAMKAGSTV